MKLLALLLIITLGGCQNYNSNSADAGKYGPADIDTSDVNFVKAYPIIQSRCISCHAHAGWSIYTSTELWVEQSGRVVVGNPAASPLINRIKNFGVGGDMPQNSGNLPAEEYQALVDWVTNIPP